MPSLWSLVQIASRLGCSVAYLIGESDTPAVDPIDAAAVRAGITPKEARRFLPALANGEDRTDT